jgi:hypothetical protein
VQSCRNFYWSHFAHVVFQTQQATRSLYLASRAVHTPPAPSLPCFTRCFFFLSSYFSTNPLCGRSGYSHLVTKCKFRLRTVFFPRTTRKVHPSYIYVSKCLADSVCRLERLLTFCKNTFASPSHLTAQRVGYRNRRCHRRLKSHLLVYGI